MATYLEFLSVFDTFTRNTLALGNVLFTLQSDIAPVAYQVILEPGVGQLREFESPRVSNPINSWGLFLVHKLTCGKRESVS